MTVGKLTYKRAEPGDSGMLTKIAIISKKYWGYSETLLEQWKSDLEIGKDYIAGNVVYKIYLGSEIIGFYGLKFSSEFDCYKIDHLWLLPDYIGNGFGRQIFMHLSSSLINQLQSRAVLVAEPNAVGFYDKMGGQVIGNEENKISGRNHLVYSFDLFESQQLG